MESTPPWALFYTLLHGHYCGEVYPSCSPQTTTVCTAVWAQFKLCWTGTQTRLRHGTQGLVTSFTARPAVSKHQWIGYIPAQAAIRLHPQSFGILSSSIFPSLGGGSSVSLSRISVPTEPFFFSSLQSLCSSLRADTASFPTEPPCPAACHLVRLTKSSN